MTIFSGRIKKWLMRDRDRAFLENLPDRAWGDMGLTKGDALELVDARPDVRERMLAMAARYGLGAEDIDPQRQAALDIALACGRCRSTGVCARYLAGMEGVAPDEFCPNAKRYADMVAAA